MFGFCDHAEAERFCFDDVVSLPHPLTSMVNMNMSRFTHTAAALLSAAIALTGLTLLMRATDPNVALSVYHIKGCKK